MSEKTFHIRDQQQDYEDDEDPRYTIASLRARIQTLQEALRDMVSAHDGYRQGMGPCICGAHENARAALAASRGRETEGKP